MPGRRNFDVENLRLLWYGEERGEAENTGALPKAKPLSAIVDKLSARLIPEFQRKLFAVRDAWPKIAGVSNARFSTPVFIQDGVLHVEISHPAYRMAVDTPAMKKMILGKIASELGADFCTALVFVPAGRRAAGKKQDGVSDERTK